MSSKVFIPQGTNQTSFNPQLQYFDYICGQVIKENIKPGIDLSNSSFTIENSNPENYLSTYIMACRTGAKLSVSPEIAEDFKKKFSVILDNEQKKKKRMYLFLLSFNATFLRAVKSSFTLTN